MTGAARVSALDAIRFGFHAGRRDLTNLSFRRHGAFDGFVVSMHQSGGHWLAYMLSLGLTREAGLPPPEHIADPAVISGPKRRPRHVVRPRIGVAHTIPSPLMGCPAVGRLLGLPCYVILVRDVRHALVSHFRKHGAQYGVGFAEFLRGDVAGKRFSKDVWWDIRFLNRWGGIHRAAAPRTLVLRYEDLCRDTAGELGRVCDFLGIRFADRAGMLRYMIAEAGKDAMAARENPSGGEAVVRFETRSLADWFPERERVFFNAVVDRFLKHRFGYDYADWSPSEA